jgi:tRNA-(ms[2]io[6]A)-hydroxylase
VAVRLTAVPRSLDPSPIVRSPLRWETPPLWVETALADPRALLNDHAHLERKAASNALELINRWPYPVQVHGGGLQAAAADRWSLQLASIARDEILHLRQVLRFLRERGGHFERSHVNAYAAALRAEVRRGAGQSELLDRLLVSALIEARSCERFGLLGERATDVRLRHFYDTLVVSEQGHYRDFLELAGLLREAREPWRERWDQLLDREAEIMQSLPPGPAMHSGPPPA